MTVEVLVFEDLTCRILTGVDIEGLLATIGIEIGTDAMRNVEPVGHIVDVGQRTEYTVYIIVERVLVDGPVRVVITGTATISTLCSVREHVSFRIARIGNAVRVVEGGRGAQKAQHDTGQVRTLLHAATTGIGIGDGSAGQQFLRHFRFTGEFDGSPRPVAQGNDTGLFQMADRSTEGGEIVTA